MYLHRVTVAAVTGQQTVEVRRIHHASCCLLMTNCVYTLVCVNIHHPGDCIKDEINFREPISV